MYGLTRGTVTLIGAAVAGLLVWIATQVSDTSTGGYWAVYGLIAAAGAPPRFRPVERPGPQMTTPRLRPPASKRQPARTPGRAGRASAAATASPPSVNNSRSRSVLPSGEGWSGPRGKSMPAA